jgi:aspartate/glutamate racemase
VIYDELVRGELSPRSRQAYIEVIDLYGRPEPKA